MDSVIGSKSQAADFTDDAFERFEELLRIAIDLKLERLKFQDYCNNWCYATEQASDSITEIEKRLVKVNHTTNCVSLGGVSTAIVGTLMGIAGVTLALPTAGTSLVLIGGTSAAAVGGGLSIGSHLIKNRLSRSLCEKAKKALDEAINITAEVEKQRTAYFETLFKFKDCVEKLTITELQQANFQLEEWTSLVELQFDEETKRSLHPTVNRMKIIEPEKIMSKEERLARIIFSIINAISEDPLARKLLRLVEKSDIVQKLLPRIDLSNGFRNTEESAKFLLQSSLAVYEVAKNSKATMKTTLQSLSKTVRIGIGFLNVLFLAWGMLDLVTTSINVHHGSKSNESKQLFQIAKEMRDYREEVMRVLKDVFGWEFVNNEVSTNNLKKLQ